MAIESTGSSIGSVGSAKQSRAPKSGHEPQQMSTTTAPLRYQLLTNAYRLLRAGLQKRLAAADQHCRDAWSYNTALILKCREATKAFIIYTI